MQFRSHTAQVNSARALWLATHTQDSICYSSPSEAAIALHGFLAYFSENKTTLGAGYSLG